LQIVKATLFKFGTQVEHGQLLPTNHKLAPKWAWPGQRDPILKFWDPSMFRTRIKLHFEILYRDRAWAVLRMEHKSARKWGHRWLRSRDPISQFNLAQR